MEIIQDYKNVEKRPAENSCGLSVVKSTGKVVICPQ